MFLVTKRAEVRCDKTQLKLSSMVRVTICGYFPLCGFMPYRRRSPWKSHRFFGTGLTQEDMPILDTRGKRDLMGTLIGDLVLALMSFFSQSERDAIRKRQAEGIAVAKAKGIKFGAASMKPPAEFPRIYSQWAKGELSARQAAKMLGVSHHTFLKWARKLGSEANLNTRSLN